MLPIKAGLALAATVQAAVLCLPGCNASPSVHAGSKVHASQGHGRLNRSSVSPVCRHKPARWPPLIEQTAVYSGEPCGAVGGERQPSRAPDDGVVVNRMPCMCTERPYDQADQTLFTRDAPAHRPTTIASCEPASSLMAGAPHAPTSAPCVTCVDSHAARRGALLMTKTSSLPPSAIRAKRKNQQRGRLVAAKSVAFPRRSSAATAASTRASSKRLGIARSSWGRKNRHGFGKPTKIDYPASL